MDIQLWNGQPATLQATTVNNWRVLQNISNTFDKTNNHHLAMQGVSFDLTQYDTLNREWRNTFLKNARLAQQFLNDACENCNSRFVKHDKTLTYQVPQVPVQLYFDVNSYNSFWQTIKAATAFLNNVINANHV